MISWVAVCLITLAIHCLPLQTKTMRNNLYNLDWNNFDRANRQLLFMILVASTPDASVKLGSFQINLESFAKVLKQ